jgi:hypothetical protein
MDPGGPYAPGSWPVTIAKNKSTAFTLGAGTYYVTWQYGTGAILGPRTISLTSNQSTTVN